MRVERKLSKRPFCRKAMASSSARAPSAPRLPQLTPRLRPQPPSYFLGDRTVTPRGTVPRAAVISTPAREPERIHSAQSARSASTSSFRAGVIVGPPEPPANRGYVGAGLDGIRRPLCAHVASIGVDAVSARRIRPSSVQHCVSRVRFVSFIPSPNPTGPEERVARKRSSST